MRVLPEEAHSIRTGDLLFILGRSQDEQVYVFLGAAQGIRTDANGIVSVSIQGLLRTEYHSDGFNIIQIQCFEDDTDWEGTMTEQALEVMRVHPEDEYLLDGAFDIANHFGLSFDQPVFHQEFPEWLRLRVLQEMGILRRGV